MAADLIARVAFLNGHLTKLLDENIDYRNQISLLVHEKEKLEQQVADQGAELKEVKEILALYQKVNGPPPAPRLSECESCKEHSKTISNQNVKLNEREYEILVLEKAVKYQRKRREEETQGVDKLKNLWKEAKRERNLFRQNAENKDKEIDKLKTKLGTFERQVKSQKLIIEQHREKIEEFEEKAAKFDESVKQKEQEICQLKTNVTSLEEQVQWQKSCIQEQSAKLDELEKNSQLHGTTFAENRRLEKEIMEKRNLVTRQIRELGDAAATRRELITKAELVGQEKTNLEKKLERLTMELGNVSKERDGMHKFVQGVKLVCGWNGKDHLDELLEHVKTKMTLFKSLANAVVKKVQEKRSLEASKSNGTTVTEVARCQSPPVPDTTVVSGEPTESVISEQFEDDNQCQAKSSRKRAYLNDPSNQPKPQKIVARKLSSEPYEVLNEPQQQTEDPSLSSPCKNDALKSDTELSPVPIKAIVLEEPTKQLPSKPALDGRRRNARKSMTKNEAQKSTGCLQILKSESIKSQIVESADSSEQNLDNLKQQIKHVDEIPLITGDHKNAEQPEPMNTMETPSHNELPSCTSVPKLESEPLDSEDEFVDVEG